MSSPRIADTDIAVIGMAGRFPGARTIRALWANLRAGTESIQPISHEALRQAGVDEHTLANPHYVNAGAPLDDLKAFDGAFFGFSPRESAILDPQHRHFLECSWEALESAGYPPERFPGSIGVFAGCGMNWYFILNLLTNPALVRSVGLFLLRHTGNDKDFLPTRVSYLLNLTGPSMAIQTACSTALVAIHEAAQHLISGECDMALAGGATIEIPHGVGYLYEEGEILSPDGHCRPFDADSQGTVFGSGVGVVVLRRLRDAIESSDIIHAVIKGSAVNNDGGAKVGYLAPSVEGQAAAILEAMTVSGLRADAISYVETHGTGTALGDPIEIAALTQAFRQHTTETGFCAIGSIKSNLGHLDTAAGVASFIKVVEALKHGELPPSLHFKQPNPAIDFPRTPFYVNAELKPWPSGGRSRVAGVNSLGVGGTNAHVILQEAPPAPPPAKARSYSLLLLSAKSEPALHALTSNYAEAFGRSPEVSLADAAYTTAVGRRAFEHRRIVVARSPEEMCTALAQAPGRLISGRQTGDTPSIAMMFPGGGTQYPGMAVGLYREERRFREAIDRCLIIASKLGHRTLRDHMFPSMGAEGEAAQALERPASSVLSVFVVEYALAQLWMSWGIKPAALIGHSLGEYVAACIARVMSLESALALVAKRGELFERLQEGAMLGVPLGEPALRAMAELGELAIAAVNGPELTVVSGSIGAIDALQAGLRAREIESKRLHIAVAAHSGMLDPFLPEFERFVSTIQLAPATIPFISNVSGTWADANEVTRADYWVRHLRSTVRFSAGLMTLLENPARVLLEVGPGQTLTALARLHRVSGRAPRVVASLPHAAEKTSDLRVLYEGLGGLWIEGAPIDWDAFYADELRRRVELPTYAFDRTEHWIAPGVPTQALYPIPASEDVVLPRSDDINEWPRVPRWHVLPSLASVPSISRTWLVMAGPGSRSRAIVSVLEARGDEVITLRPGSSFARTQSEFVIRPTEGDDYRVLWNALDAEGRLPSRLLHLWLVDSDASLLEDEATPLAVRARQQMGFETLFVALQTLAEHAGDSELEAFALTAGLFSVSGESTVCPDQATVLGPVLVVPREYPTWRCRAVDLDAAEGAGDLHRWAEGVLLECSRNDAPAITALRGSTAWSRSFERCRMSEGTAATVLRHGGTYLITGGFGGIALNIAERLAHGFQAKLGLLSRAALPLIRARRDAVKDLERSGARVVPLTADVTDADELTRAVASFESQCGPVNGIIHTAGVIDDGLLAMRSLDQARAVIAPKLEGTLALQRVFAGRPLDFFVVCSSTSALVGLPGQIDYVAANAFLDAFAHHAGATHPLTLSINWGTWRDAGMAIRASSSRTPQNADADDLAPHPLLGRQTRSTARSAEFQSIARPDQWWVLSEHRLKDGTPVLPGTAYLELARSACHRVSGASAIEITDLAFLEALEVASVRTIRTCLSEAEAGVWNLSVDSAIDEYGPWTEHLQARVRAVREVIDPTSVESLDSVQARFGTAQSHGGELDVWDKQARHMVFGPRWNVARALHVGRGEALAFLSLDPRFVADSTVFLIHPALFDFATASALAALDGYGACPDFFVPFAYERVTAAALGTAVWAHSRIKPGMDATSPVILADVTIYGVTGDVVAVVEGFAMRRLTSDHLGADRSAAQTRAGGPVLTPSALIARLIERGVRSEEGAVAFERVLSAKLGPQVVLSPVDPAALAYAVDRVYPPMRLSAASTSGAGATSAAVRGLDVIEQTIAGMWEELLGVRDVELDDNFFALGGHSLTAVRLTTRLERAFHAGLRVSAVFEAPTIRLLADRIRSSSVSESGVLSAQSDAVQPSGLGAERSQPPLVAVARDAFLVNRSTWALEDEEDD